MNAQELEIVKKHYVKFLRSGFKPKLFTNVLYQAFYIYSNLFIAHYDKSGFYSSRFGSAKGLVETVHVLMNTAPRNETHKALKEVTKECIQYFEERRQFLIASELNQFEKQSQELISSINQSF